MIIDIHIMLFSKRGRLLTKSKELIFLLLQPITLAAVRWVARPARRDRSMILEQQFRALTASACRDIRGFCLPLVYFPVARVKRRNTRIRWAMAFALIAQKTHGLVLPALPSRTVFACQGISRRRSSAVPVLSARSSPSMEMDLSAAPVLKIAQR